MNQKVYQNIFGVDVASRKLDLACAQSNQHQEIENSTDSIERWVNQLKRLKGKTLVVMEATGGYEHQLVEILQEHEIDCSIVNPLQIRTLPRAVGSLKRTTVSMLK